MTCYFAYGANMDPVHMAKACPEAIRLGLAVLPGRSFQIAATGYGDATPAAKGELLGVLWELSPRDEATLDAFEGVPDGLYWKERATVRDSAERPVTAMLYRAADAAPGRPVPGYLERIIEVAESLGFPVSYVDTLRRCAAAG